jgi:hypothetical protein
MAYRAFLYVFWFESFSHEAHLITDRFFSVKVVNAFWAILVAILSLLFSLFFGVLEI